MPKVRNQKYHHIIPSSSYYIFRHAENLISISSSIWAFRFIINKSQFKTNLNRIENVIHTRSLCKNKNRNIWWKFNKSLQNLTNTFLSCGFLIAITSDEEVFVSHCSILFKFSNKLRLSLKRHLNLLPLHSKTQVALMDVGDIVDCKVSILKCLRSVLKNLQLIQKSEFQTLLAIIFL